MKELQKQDKDKIENVKQQVQEIKTIFDYRIKPQKNHVLFEINLIENTIEKAEFDELPNVKWEDALKGIISLQKKITKRPNCVYVSALNVENVRKILKRDFNIQLS
jgi:hypothetical protein